MVLCQTCHSCSRVAESKSITRLAFLGLGFTFTAFNTAVEIMVLERTNTQNVLISGMQACKPNNLNSNLG